MNAAAHNPEFAKKVGVPQSVAKDFNQGLETWVARLEVLLVDYLGLYGDQ